MKLVTNYATAYLRDINTEQLIQSQSIKDASFIFIIKERLAIQNHEIILTGLMPSSTDFTSYNINLDFLLKTSQDKKDILIQSTNWFYKQNVRRGYTETGLFRNTSTNKTYSFFSFKAEFKEKMEFQQNQTEFLAKFDFYEDQKDALDISLCYYEFDTFKEEGYILNQDNLVLEVDIN